MIYTAGQKLASLYPNDIEEESVGSELLQFSKFVKLCVEEKKNEESC